VSGPVHLVNTVPPCDVVAVAATRTSVVEDVAGRGGVALFERDAFHRGGSETGVDCRGLILSGTIVLVEAAADRRRAAM
jgi:hypothetical protein